MSIFYSFSDHGEWVANYDNLGIVSLNFLDDCRGGHHLCGQAQVVNSHLEYAEPNHTLHSVVISVPRQINVALI